MTALPAGDWLTDIDTGPPGALALGACAVFVGAVADVSALALGVPIRVGVVLPVLLGVLLGPGGALAVVGGLTVYALSTWAFDAGALVPVVGGVAATLVASALRPTLGGASLRRRVAAGAAVAWTASLVGLAVAAWSGAVLGVRPFVTTVSVSGAEAFSVLVLAPLGVAVLAPMAIDATSERVSGNSLSLALLGAGWLCFGTGFSLARMWSGSIPAPVIRQYLPAELAGTYVSLVQESPFAVQALAGVAFLLAIVLLLRGSNAHRT